MTKTLTTPLDIIEMLARHLAIELDLQYDDLDHTTHQEELFALTAACQYLTKEGVVPHEAVGIVLARAATNCSRIQ